MSASFNQMSTILRYLTTSVEETMKRIFIVSTLLLLVVTACTPAQTVNIESLTATVAAVDAARTAAAKTTIASFTSTPAPAPTAESSPTPPSEVKTAAPTPPAAPSQTPSSSSKMPCDWIGLVTDVTIPDGATLFPDTVFTKTWEIRNGGSCTWNSQYTLVYAEGERMGAVATVPLVEGSKTVPPGQTVQVSVQMTAPAATGKKTGYWILKNPAGVKFGVGSDGTKPFWIEINVSKSISLLANMCSAIWVNASEVLACPGKTTDTKGSVSRVENPKFAGGYVENEPALLLIPQQVTDGVVIGRFAPMPVAKSDFVTLVACAFDAPQCNARVVFTAQEAGGTEKTLLDVVKNAGNGTSQYSIDMSANGLVGKMVTFRMYVRANGNPTDDRIYWVNPRWVSGP